MRAALYKKFKSPLEIVQLPNPVPGPDDVIIRVRASGICRSDWHGWQGHDSDIRLPHVPGHELAGTVEIIGSNIKNWKKGDRVTVPFCGGCGYCIQCKKGQEQVCDHYFQPGFTGWGSFADLVKIEYADHNLVRLPDSVSYTTAALLGCRFITAWRGVISQGRLVAQDWIAIHGCGGVGLSAIMIAAAHGAIVIAVDIDDAKLQFAKNTGAAYTLNARHIKNIPAAIKEISKEGVSISVDALGSWETCKNSVLSLRKQGRHIQLGLLSGSDANPPIPMSDVIARELELIGSHGMQAHQYPAMMDMIVAGRLKPEKLLGKIVSLEEGVKEMMDMNSFKNTGVTIIAFND